MPIYHFTIKNDWHTKKGFIVSNSPWNAKDQIERKAQIGKNGKITVERVSDKNSIGEFFGSRIVNYQDPWQSSTSEEKDSFYIYDHVLKHTLEDSILHEEDLENMSYEDVEGFKYLY